jgi:hypothetical protein
MTIDKQAVILQEVIDHLNAAYTALVQLGNYDTFTEVRGTIVHLTTRLEDFI